MKNIIILLKIMVVFSLPPIIIRFIFNLDNEHGLIVAFSYWVVLSIIGHIGGDYGEGFWSKEKKAEMNEILKKLL